jgi:hypothetical protein
MTDEAPRVSIIPSVPGLRTRLAELGHVPNDELLATLRGADEPFDVLDESD